MPARKARICVILAATFVLLGCGYVSAQTDSRGNGREVLNQGLDCFYNSDYVCAEKKFGEYMKLEPDDSVGNWRAVLNYFFWLRFKQKTDIPKLDAESYKELAGLISDGIQKAELQSGAATGEAAGFYLAAQSSLHSVEALLEYGNGFSGASKNFRKSADEASRAAESGSPYGIYLFGLMHYKIGSKSMGERWFLNAASGFFRFQRRKGIEMMFSVPFRVQPEFSPDVWLYLFRLVVEEDAKETKSRLTPEIRKGIEEFAAKYPRNEYVYKYSLRGAIGKKR